MVKTLKRTLHWLGYVSGASIVQARRQKAGRILMYHGVGDDSLTPEVFDKQLRYLASRFRIVPLANLVGQLERGDPVNDNDIALTFDDGLRNNVTVAYPILQRMRLPATFFVCPGLVGTDQWIWTYALRTRLQHVQESGGAAALTAAIGCQLSADEFVDWLKTQPVGIRKEAQVRLFDATRDFSPSARQRELFDLASWDELRGLDPRLITIGSHTVTHPILTSLSAADAQYEIRESRRMLEERLQRPVEFFCYPNGTASAQVIEWTRIHYRAAVSTEYGLLRPGHDRHFLARIPICDEPELLAWRLHRPRA